MTENSISIRKYITDNISQSKTTADDLTSRMSKITMKTSLGARLSDIANNDKVISTNLAKNDQLSCSISKDISAMPLLNFNFDNDVNNNELEKNISNLQKNTLNIKGLEQMQSLLVKVKPGYSLSLEDYSIINNMNDLVTQKLKSQSSLSNEDKLALENFSQAFQKLSERKQNTEIAYKDYNLSLQNTSAATDELSKQFADVEAGLKEKGISSDMLKLMMSKRLQAGVSIPELAAIQEGKMSPQKMEKILDKFRKAGVSDQMIKLFMDNYKEVLMAGLLKSTLDNYNKVLKESGNNPTIGLALYQVYIQKVISYVNDPDKSKDPGGLARIMNSYNNLVEYIGKISSSNISSEEKEKQLSELVTKYAGNDSQQSELLNALIKKEFAKDIDFSEALGLVNGAITSLSKDNSSEPMKRITETLISGADQKDLEIAKSATPDTYKFIDASAKIKDCLKKFANNNDKLIHSENNFIKETRLLAQELKSFNILMQSPQLNKALTNIVIKEAEETSGDKIERSANEQINEIIDNIDKLQSNLNLNIDPGQADIIPLLEKFRKIINTLDVDTKLIIEKELQAKLIDSNFSKSIKDKKEKELSYIIEQSKIKEIFENSNEVRLSSLPFSVKQLRFSENSAKIALLSLNGIN